MAVSKLTRKWWPLRTCKSCGWVHFGVSLKYAKSQVKRFKAYYDSIPRQQQIDFYGGKVPELKTYLFCNFCKNSYTQFRVAKAGDCTSGCTIGPILHTRLK